MKTTWKVDATHSELFFKIKHLMISDLTGALKSFDLQVETKGNDFGEVTDVQLRANLQSLTTNNADRDTHLASADFFATEKYPLLSFEGTKFEKQGFDIPSVLNQYRKDYKLSGNLTIKGITHNITLDGEFGGTAVDAEGQKRAGFTIRGKIKRSDFGIDWQGVPIAGKIILGDDVIIFGNIQLVKQG